MTIKGMSSFGYGLVDKDEKPWWDEECVCQDQEPMQDTADRLNDYPEDDDRCPYRVVKLFFVSSKNE